MDYSLRGVARQFGGRTGNFSVKSCMMPSVGPGRHSLSRHMRGMCRRNHSFSKLECIYSWTAAFEQTWAHIIVRIHLHPDSGISAATMNTLRQRWKTGIENTWSERWGVGRPGEELTSRLTFEVIWTDNYDHHDVDVHVGNGGTDMSNWHTGDNGDVAAHEFGHMLGLEDEYSEFWCPGRSPTGTGTVMDNNSNTVPSRMMRRFADNLGSIVVAL